jgi:hypothetical protein
MSIKPGMLGPLISIDIGAGIVGAVIAIAWGKLVQPDMDRTTVVFLCQMFGGISLVFLVVILLNI